MSFNEIKSHKVFRTIDKSMKFLSDDSELKEMREKKVMTINYDIEEDDTKRQTKEINKI